MGRRGGSRHPGPPDASRGFAARTPRASGPPAQALAAEARALEVRVSDLVNAAYGLTPEEVRLMWETAPPRMPIAPPPPAREGG